MSSSTIDLYLASDLIGFSAGLVLNGLFLILVLKSARLPGTPRANLFLSACSLTWNLGGLVHSCMIAMGKTDESDPSSIFMAIKLIAAIAWPIPALMIWQHYSQPRWQKICSVVLQIVAAGGVIAASVGFLSPFVFGIAPLPASEVKKLATEFISSFGIALLIFGTALLLKGRLSRAIWLSYFTVLLGIFGSAVALFLHHALTLPVSCDTALLVLSKQSTLLILFGSFFLFARFRFADVFIRQSFRTLLAAAMAVVWVLLIRGPFLAEITSHTAAPNAVWVSGATAIAALFLLCFTVADRSMNVIVQKWIFRAPDYRAATQRLGETLSALHVEAEIAGAAEQIVCTVLELQAARLLRHDKVARSAKLGSELSGEIIELDPSDLCREDLGMEDLEFLVPVCSAGTITHVIAIVPGRARRALVTHELSFLRTVAMQVGQRFDSLRAERETIERRSREALLLQQVTEAELRALRAQINPHFLFNSLNTIADLIVTDPARAETMTLRLSQVFRHMLTHSSRALTSVADEIAFVRTYLFIEEARFGDRLKFDFDIATEVLTERIPSLILQPIVENALKHGLAPRPGPGHLRIAAVLRGDSVCVTVDDDGVGLRSTGVSNLNGQHPFGSPKSETATGVGLRNVAERLRALYQDRAGISLTPGKSGGSCVTILIPTGGAVAS